MRDSLIEMVSQRANSVCVSRRFITQTCVRIDCMYSSLAIAEAASAALKKKAGRDVLVNEDMIGQWPPS